MTLLFDPTPSSLNTLSAGYLSELTPHIYSVSFNVVIGQLAVRRGQSVDRALFSETADTSQDNSVIWRYLVGDENMLLISSICNLIEDGTLGDLGIAYVYYNDSYLNVANISESSSATLRNRFEAALAMEFENIALGTEPIDQFIWGDRRTYIRSFETPIPNDTISSGDGNDVVNGLTGDDSLFGAGGNDELYGGFGNDDLYGGVGDDYLYGQENSDRLFGNAGDDYLDGGLGADFMQGGEGNDTYLVDNVNDVVRDNGSSLDIDTILVPQYLSYRLSRVVENAELTGNHDGEIRGNQLNNNITGNEGDNTLAGGRGNDSVSSGTGSDTLEGGRAEMNCWERQATMCLLVAMVAIN